MNLATSIMGPPIWQIATDGSYLNGPVKLIQSSNRSLCCCWRTLKSLLTLPENRARHLCATRLRLHIPQVASTAIPPVGKIMQFRVVPSTIGADTSYNPATLTPIRTGTQTIKPLVNFTTGTLNPSVVVAQKRQMTLNEVMGMAVRIGNVNFRVGR
jgi:hypothetical protein